ncbi:MAG: hypothetical protein M0R03_21435 [Novosphingobium sp.]|jgi:hypothetical protein|nr:hypothetical protein [Novosphingobium sp.]
MAKKDRNIKKLFQVEFSQKVLESVVKHHIEQIDGEINDRSVSDAVHMATELTIGRILHEATPRITDTLKNEFGGYRITVELIDGSLENPLDIEDTKSGLIINTKIKKKIDF